MKWKEGDKNIAERIELLILAIKFCKKIDTRNKDVIKAALFHHDKRLKRNNIKDDAEDSKRKRNQTLSSLGVE